MSRGKRPSVVVGRKLPKRACCPSCSNNGVKTPRATEYGILRECQYCYESWLPDAWAAAIAKATQP